MALCTIWLKGPVTEGVLVLLVLRAVVEILELHIEVGFVEGHGDSVHFHSEATQNHAKPTGMQ